VQSDEDSIPLHIMLLLMDEVFDLKSRNQWLRRRIMAILQQIAKTMFGDSINRLVAGGGVSPLLVCVWMFDRKLSIKFYSILRGVLSFSSIKSICVCCCFRFRFSDLQFSLFLK